MQRTIDLARQAQGWVEPNPMVGCILVKDSQIIGQGWHQQFGGPHAEVNAILSADGNLDDATMYVNLEPCCHDGKTPPCTELILGTGIRRVVVGTADPFPKVAGRGLQRLRENGIEVDCGVLEQQCRELNAPFFTLLQGRAWVIAKWAMTLDGKIATHTGNSQWISNDRSRQRVYQLRGRVDAIMVGSSTVLADNPQLTARVEPPDRIARVATRIVVDSTCRIPLDCTLVQTAHNIPTLIATTNRADSAKIEQLQAAGCDVWLGPSEGGRVDLNSLFLELARRSFSNVLVEGGGKLLGSLVDAHLIDEVHVFVAPIITGGAKAHSAIAGAGVEFIELAHRLNHVRIQQLGTDVYITGTIRR